MQTENKTFYWLALSNIITAFGGGMILAKGIACLHADYLNGGSILAFFTGTLLGLAFLQTIPASVSKSLTRYFSFFGAITSLVLLKLFDSAAIDQTISGSVAYLFFFLLSIRFGFWFYSRVRRVAEAAKIQHRIGWVELGYYIGIISGLVFWKLFNIQITFMAALLIDALLQAVAGLIDVFTFSRVASSVSDKPVVQSQPTEKNGGISIARILIMLTTLTVSTQAIVFSLAHVVSANAGTYFMAIFYFGVAVAAYFYKSFLFRLDWKPGKSFPNLVSGKLSLNLFYCLLLLSASIFTCVYLTEKIGLSAVFNLKSAFLLCLILAASFIYELLALSLLDRINLANTSNPDTIIFQSYGLMGIGSAVAIWSLGLFDNNYPSLITMLLTCSLITTITAFQKHNRNNRRLD